MLRPLLALAAAALCVGPLLGCLPDEEPVGLRLAPAGTGPRVAFDLDVRPLPDIPFPNDLLTRPDPASPTGVRVNLSRIAPSAAESRLREAALNLDGFGTSSPIHVRFDAPLDLDVLVGAGRAFGDDPVKVVDLTEGPTFGETIPLDLGRGHFPVRHTDPTTVAFPRDARAEADNLLFETVDEDLDGDGELDPGEDTDNDGVLDRANGGPGLSPFYERQSDTLVLRPVVPLRPGHRYAVVLTDRVVGLDGATVRSPFPYIHHIQHTEALRRLPEALAEHGLTIEQVAYAWVFSTQSATRELDALRDGLAGRGAFDWLATCVPEGLIEAGDPDVLVVGADELGEVGARLTEDPELAARIDAEWAAVSHVVAGSIGTPYLLDDRDLGGPERLADLGAIRLDDETCLDTVGDTRSGLRVVPGDDDEAWEVDVARGRMSAVLGEVDFVCVVPRRATAAPLPVVLWAHDLGGHRFEALRVAGRLAGWGMATCAIDAVGHGAIDLEQTGVVPFDTVLSRHRARDLDGDGRPDPAADAFSDDALHTRDVLRQTTLDWLQFVRVLRSFDGQRSWRTRPSQVSSAMAGDFDDDGAVDFGGPDAAYFMAGEGYGGLVSTLVGALEPALVAVAPISPAGGLMDVMTRSAAPRITAGVVLPMMGPLVIGLPEVGPSGQQRRGTLVSIWTNAVDGVAHGDDEAELGLPILQLPPLSPGQQVMLTNLDDGTRVSTRVAADGGFRLALGMDALMGSERQEWLAAGQPLTELGDRFRLMLPGLDPPTQLAFDYAVELMGAAWAPRDPLVAVGRGWASDRQTPGFRRLALIMQTLLEPADPVNYARRLLAEPVQGPDGSSAADVLLVLTAGDDRMPVSAGLNLGRAAGLWDPGGPVDQQLIELDVVEGIAARAPLVDVDLLPGTPLGERVFDPPLRHTVSAGERGESALRIAHLDSAGAHGLNDHPALIEMIARFFATGTTAVDACLATADCARP